MEQEKATTYQKNGNKWEKTFETYSIETVKNKLLYDLINKNLCKCLYIKSIKRVNHFDGWQTVTVYYDNGVKTEYFIKSH